MLDVLHASRSTGDVRACSLAARCIGPALSSGRFRPEGPPAAPGIERFCVIPHMPRSAYDYPSIHRRMTVEELRKAIKQYAAKETEHGLAAKARRSWKELKHQAEAELSRRFSEG
ncbi:MAG: hypothetical protein JWM57_1327 [Phycisphaerales bacterium]|nr:hypothetical protein [Phycisphaerales bacterium]